MANLVWQKNKSLSKPSVTLSPRQVANKAYTLACKKLDRDEHRCRPHYDVRERLLLYTTMCKAETVLHKSPSQRCHFRIADDDDVMGDSQVYQRKNTPSNCCPSSPICHQAIDREQDECQNSVPPQEQHFECSPQAPQQFSQTSSLHYCPLIPQDCRLAVHHDVLTSLRPSHILI